MNLNLPWDPNGNLYELKNLKGDQLEIACVVMKTLLEWIKYNRGELANDKAFEPLRMIIRGAAGTGKSVLINTTVTVIRKLFVDNDAVHVMAPTGAAAFNVLGETIHRMLGINIWDADKELSGAAKKRMSGKLARTVALIFDERSMISQDILGAAETNASATAHGMGHDNEDWGGIPIILMFGDDYQLPPSMSSGAFDTVSVSPRLGAKGTGARSNGCQQFLKFSTNKMELTLQKRQHDEQTFFKEFLDSTRFGKVTPEQADEIEHLHMNMYTPEEQKQIMDNPSTMFLFANKIPMYEHNFNKIGEVCSEENPAACIKAKTTGHKKKAVSSHFDEDSTPSTTLMCRDCKVQICGKNFRPEWGLFNGAIGVGRTKTKMMATSPNISLSN